MSNKTLIICSTITEAKISLELINPNTTIIALNLEVEFFLMDKMPGYKNPLYALCEMDGYISGARYFLDNFKVAHNWYKNQNYKFIQDRLGFFLMELDRAMDFATRTLKMYPSGKVIIQPLTNYKSAQVMNGNLISDAFSLIAKEKNIKVVFFPEEKIETTTFARIGWIFEKIRYLNKMTAKDSCSLLILAPPRHLLQMSNFVKEIESNRINYKILTYNVTFAIKNKLDKLYATYLEKEKLINKNELFLAGNMYQNIYKEKEWITFTHPKYIKNKVVTSYIRLRIKRYVEEELETILVDKLLADDLIAQLHPKLLLTVTDPDTKAYTFIESAQKSKIKTISFQHGADFQPIPYSVPLSDKYIVWGSIAKKWFLRNDYTSTLKQFPLRKILIGESPLHSYKKPLAIRRQTGVKKVLFLSTIHFFDQGAVSYYQKKLFEILKEYEDLEVMVRTHDYQNIVNLRALVHKMESKAYFVNDRTLTDCLKEADVVLFESTTAGFDSLLAGKPTLFFNPYDGQSYIGNKKNVIGTILSPDEIKPKLDALLNDKGKQREYAAFGRKFVISYLGIRAKNPYARSIKLLKSLLK